MTGQHRITTQHSIMHTSIPCIRRSPRHRGSSGFHPESVRNHRSRDVEDKLASEERLPPGGNPFKAQPGRVQQMHVMLIGMVVAHVHDAALGSLSHTMRYGLGVG